MFRKLRILFLLLVLLFVALGTWLERSRSTDWKRTLWVAVYPIAADDTPAVDAYIRSLSDETFAPIGQFIGSEAHRYGVKLAEPARVLLYNRIANQPPALQPDAGILSRALWSLRLRYWAWHASGGQKRAPPTVRMFVLYHDPARVTSVPHSLGLQKGLLGVVHAFADRAMTGSNNIVIAHEFLHTLGALDKYDANNRPLFPIGYAQPDRDPLYPQPAAEIMAGRRLLSETELDMPESLAGVVAGPQTAREIGWSR